MKSLNYYILILILFHLPQGANEALVFAFTIVFQKAIMNFSYPKEFESGG